VKKEEGRPRVRPGRKRPFRSMVARSAKKEERDSGRKNRQVEKTSSTTTTTKEPVDPLVVEESDRVTSKRCNCVPMWGWPL
jgi:hypothetical protein